MRKSAILWLIPGVLFGLITLGGIAAGAYWVHLTHSQVGKFEKDVEDATAQLADVKKGPLPDAFKINAKSHDLHVAEVDLENSRRERIIAATVSSTVVIPGLLTLVFLVMSVMRFMQKPKPPKVEEEDDEEEEEEAEEKETEPPVKKKATAKSKPKDDDDA